MRINNVCVLFYLLASLGITITPPKPDLRLLYWQTACDVLINVQVNKLLLWGKSMMFVIDPHTMTHPVKRYGNRMVFTSVLKLYKYFLYKRGQLGTKNIWKLSMNYSISRLVWLLRASKSIIKYTNIGLQSLQQNTVSILFDQSADII
jgi:hypothetical protein